jgi:hypothetical protein
MMDSPSIADLTYRGATSTTVKVEANGCRGVYFGKWEQPVAWP